MLIRRPLFLKLPKILFFASPMLPYVNIHTHRPTGAVSNSARRAYTLGDGSAGRGGAGRPTDSRSRSRRNSRKVCRTALRRASETVGAQAAGAGECRRAGPETGGGGVQGAADVQAIGETGLDFAQGGPARRTVRRTPRPFRLARRTGLPSCCTACAPSSP